MSMLQKIRQTLITPNTDVPQMTSVKFAHQTIPVIKGGYYDRFRMNPNLDEVSKDPNIGNLDFFRTLPKRKTKSRLGKIWGPNFFYKVANAQLLMLAPLKTLQAHLPKPLEPLKAVPGYGLVALTFFEYQVCDNDPYNEIALAIITKKPQGLLKLPNALELAKAVHQRTFYAHVLALPVNTEIARVRGVEAYQLPKWLTRIDFDLNAEQLNATLFNPDGSLDISLTVPTPSFTDNITMTKMARNCMLHLVDGQWCQTEVIANPLSATQQLMPKNVQLIKGEGRVTDLLNELQASKIVRMDIAKQTQSALYLPKPIKL